MKAKRLLCNISLATLIPAYPFGALITGRSSPSQNSVTESSTSSNFQVNDKSNRNLRTPRTTGVLASPSTFEESEISRMTQSFAHLVKSFSSQVCAAFHALNPFPTAAGAAGAAGAGAALTSGAFHSRWRYQLSFSSSLAGGSGLAGIGSGLGFRVFGWVGCVGGAQFRL